MLQVISQESGTKASWIFYFKGFYGYLSGTMDKDQIIYVTEMDVKTLSRSSLESS